MLLKIKNITLSFAKGKDSFKILNGLNLDVPKGKITALIGGNGAGKTTLFNIISGFQKDFSGEISYCHCGLDPQPPLRLENLRADKISRLGIGRLFQSKGLLPHLTLLDNMKLCSNDTSGEFPFAYLFRNKKLLAIENEKEMKAKNILTQLFGENNKYLGMLNAMGCDFSYGEQRLLSLAGLFMGNYDLLLLDEPTAGVNPVYIENIKDIIRKMVAAGKTVLLIEHNMLFVKDLADIVAYMDDGQIKFTGTPNEIINNQEVKNSYLGIE
ncbi:ABC transporter ATP-binding protein [Bacteroidia bacterium]|nr:ABC transporter ATP-binding protein [Bacteroidia bacterium]GHV71854.1 ABC transporter ATP-binding protein [Bacteroidia bacterium]